MPVATRRLRGAATTILVCALLLIAAPAAAEPPPVIWKGESSKSIEYGEYWEFGVYFPAGVTIAYTFHNTGVPASYTPSMYTYPDPLDNVWLIGGLGPSYDAPPLKAGAYTFSLHVKETYGPDTTYESETETPAHLTVAPASLGLTLRVLPDVGNSENAIATVAFTGRFVDAYTSSTYPGAAISPAGEWHIVFTDSEGTVAVERTIERAAGDDVLATSFSWPDGKPGETYAVSAEFLPRGDSGANFTVTPASEFSYTASESARPVPTSTAAAEPGAGLAKPAGFGVPLGILLVVSVLVVGLGVLVTILSVRLIRLPSSVPGEVSA